MSEHIPGQAAETIEMAGPPGPRPGGRRKGLLVAGSVVGAVAVVAGGTVAAVSLTGSDAAGPASLLPASTVAYAEIDLTRATAAIPTLMKLPSVTRSIGLKKDSDLREKALTKACPDLDFAHDVAPWLGSKAAVGAVPGVAGSKEPTMAIAVEVTDEKAAEKGLAALKKCSGEDAVWSIGDGYAVVTEKQAELTAVTQAAQKAPLADDAGFQRWTGEVGRRGFLTAYASPKVVDAVADSIESGAFDDAEGKMADNPLGASGQMMDPAKTADALRKASGSFKGGAVTLRAVKSAFEVEGAAGAKAALGQGGTLAGSLPEDTTLALAAHPVEGWLDKAAANGGAAAADSMLGSVGLSFDDIGKVFGDSFALSVGTIDPTDPTDLPVGLKVDGDAAGVKHGVDRIAASLGAKGVVTTDTSGHLAAVGMSPAYRKSLLADGGLGRSAKFTGVVRDADKAAAVLYLDFDGLDDVVAREAPQQADDIKALGQLGFSLTQDGDTARTFGRLTFDE